MKLRIEPLTPERWPDLEAVFGARGCSVARGCWCMYYRLSGRQPPLQAGTTAARRNRAALKALVDAGPPPGLLAYDGETPVGWVTLAPRDQFAKLAKSPVIKPVDEQPVWSIVCFVVPSEFRGRGVARSLLDGAVAWARQQGARLVEAYPVDRETRGDDENMWFGAKSMFDRAGFVEVARRKPQRPIVRRALRPPRAKGG